MKSIKSRVWLGNFQSHHLVPSSLFISHHLLPSSPFISHHHLPSSLFGNTPCLYLHVNSRADLLATWNIDDLQNISGDDDNGSLFTVTNPTHVPRHVPGRVASTPVRRRPKMSSQSVRWSYHGGFVN